MQPVVTGRTIPEARKQMGPYQMTQRSESKSKTIELRRTGIPLAAEKGIFTGDPEPAHPLQMLT